MSSTNGFTNLQWPEHYVSHNKHLNHNRTFPYIQNFTPFTPLNEMDLSDVNGILRAMIAINCFVHEAVVNRCIVNYH